jgi:predicted secreted protein
MSKIISVSLGQEFEIVLEAVPTAGFSWELVHPSEKAGVVKELGCDWKSDSSVAGGSAQQHFRFRAITEGEANLFFRYRRPWEHTAREERPFVVRVVSKQD